MSLHRRRVKALAALCLGGATSCSLFVSLDDLSDGGAADSGVDGAPDVADANADASALDSAIGDGSTSADARVTVLPKFRAFAEADNGGGGTTISVQRDTAIQEGDLMIALVYEYSLHTTSSPPTDWTSGVVIDGTVGLYEVFSYFRFAGASEPLSYQFTISGSQYGEVDLISYSGVDPLVPFDGYATATYDSDASFALPQVMTTEMNELVLIAAVADGQSSASWTTPAGVTAHKNMGYTYFGDVPLLSPALTTGQTLLCSVAANGATLVAPLRPK